SIAPPENLQLQSHLLQLPNEIKHAIYGYCFAAGVPIIDPVINDKRQDGDNKAPVLGIALLQTCRRVYYEADRRPLFSHNIFRFTSVDRVRSFFRSLGSDFTPFLHDIEIDTRKVHSNHPGIGREWLHYLAWGGGSWGKTLGSLREDAPGLKCLRLNFESWPSIPMFRSELWNLLRCMMGQMEGLERILVIGASKGAGMAKREPWSSVHFVGGDDVGSDDLIQRMWNTVDGEDDHKVIRWTRCDGKLHLEVVSKAYLVKNIDRRWIERSMQKKQTDPWPANGT
ncbi:hypothetical protein P154DRAFT_396293, partial [Amniculicola lignicola CBS 123094]